MMEEMKSIKENWVQELVERPLGYCPISLKWVFKVKRDKHRNIIKHNVWLITQCFI
jgi:hypothetical protein